MAALKAKDDFGRLPRYELIDKDGKKVPMTFGTAQAAAQHARAIWPDQEQDEDRTGKGWDVQVVGCDR